MITKVISNFLRICADVITDLQAPTLSFGGRGLEPVVAVLLEEQITGLDFSPLHFCTARGDKLTDCFLYVTFIFVQLTVTWTASRLPLLPYFSTAFTQKT